METTVTIKWDTPQERNWLCPENIELALSAYCKNTKFEVVKQESEPALLSTLNSLMMSMKAHPDNVEGSEFADFVSLAEEEIENASPSQ